MGGASGKPAIFCTKNREDGDGTKGEPELRMVGAVGEPTAGTVSGAVGKLATFGRIEGGLGVCTDGEPELC